MRCVVIRTLGFWMHWGPCRALLFGCGTSSMKCVDSKILGSCVVCGSKHRHSNILKLSQTIRHRKFGPCPRSAHIVYSQSAILWQVLCDGHTHHWAPDVLPAWAQSQPLSTRLDWTCDWTGDFCRNWLALWCIAMSEVDTRSAMGQTSWNFWDALYFTRRCQISRRAVASTPVVLKRT